MFTLKAKILGLLIVLLVLGGCMPDTAVPVTIPPTRTAVMLETSTAVAQTPPTATFAFTPTPLPIKIHPPTNTPQATSIPRPSSTPSPTPTPRFIDLPEWIADPAANIILLENVGGRDDNYAVTVFNADTGERFDISLDRFVSPSWVWREDELFVLLYYGKLESGSVITEAYEELINISTGAVTIQPPPEFGYLSPDGRYKVRVIEGENAPPIATLTDQDTGAEVELTDPFNGQYADGIDVAWSTDGQIVGVERFRRVEDSTASYGVRAIPALAVFSLDGTLLAQYDNLDSRSLRWSPVPPYRLLYPAYSLENEPPCILDVLTGDYDCLATVAQWRDQREVETGFYKWSPDGSKIGFIYWGDWDSYESGFCYIELATDVITCPVTRDNLQVEEYLKGFATGDGIAYLYVIDYQWSPSGEYIALFINPCPPGCDDGTLASVTIAETSGENLQIIIDGHLIIIDDHLPYQSPWRPSIPSPSEE